jgi:thiol:disulfide interchange protein DsbD
MGLVSGIVAAPCTGPVLAAALTFVATKGSVLFGFAIMFTYALGLGLLFFVIGTFSITLPKSGAWMDGVKSVFGVALLAAALVFLKNVLPASRALFSAAAGAAIVAAAAAAVGVLLGALHGDFHGPLPSRLAKGLGVALLVGAVVYASGAADARSRQRSGEAFAWRHDEAGALALAHAQGRPVILDFWADWCTACKELDQLAWANPAVREEASRFVAVKVDGTDDSPEFQALLAKYGVVGMPTVVFIDARGHEVPLRVTAAIEPPEMLQVLRAVDMACDAPMPTRADALAVLRPGATRCPARW